MAESTAVVGSSAINKRGRCALAMAIRMRLPLATRKIVGVVVKAVRGFGNPDQIEQVYGPCTRGLPRYRRIHAQRFHELGAHGHQRIQAGHRLLEDQAELPATKGCEPLAPAIAPDPGRRTKSDPTPLLPPAGAA